MTGSRGRRLEVVSEPYRVVVIGGGLSGLTAAHRLSHAPGLAGRQRAIEIVVLEAQDRVGGAIWTEQVDGFTFEGGADSMITNKPWGVELCRELGLGDQLIDVSSQHRRSFVVRNGRLLPVPEGFILMAPHRLLPMLVTPILSWRGKLRMLMDLVLPARAEDGDESLASFVRRRLGREALERLVQPLVGGIYTADPTELSLKSTLPQFLAMEREHGGLIRAVLADRRAARRSKSRTKSALSEVEAQASGARYGLFVSLAQGMGTLPQTLARSLPMGTLRLNTPVRRLLRRDPTSPRCWTIELLDGPPIQADAIILATEAHSAARLVDSLDPDLALQLRSIPYASSAILNMAFRRDQIAHPLDGFGAVVPIIENRRILAISFTSVKFPTRAPSDSVLMRVFIGGATQPDLFELDDDALLAVAREEVGELLNIKGDPILARVARHARAMPQYTLGHIERIEAISRQLTQHPRLALAGNAYTGVGVPDCVRSGREAADRILDLLVDPAAIAAA